VEALIKLKNYGLAEMFLEALKAKNLHETEYLFYVRSLISYYICLERADSRKEE
jgi:hypothetical protein